MRQFNIEVISSQREYIFPRWGKFEYGFTLFAVAIEESESMTEIIDLELARSKFENIDLITIEERETISDKPANDYEGEAVTIPFQLPTGEDWGSVIIPAPAVEPSTVFTALDVMRHRPKYWKVRSREELQKTITRYLEPVFGSKDSAVYGKYFCDTLYTKESQEALCRLYYETPKKDRKNSHCKIEVKSKDNGTPVAIMAIPLFPTFADILTEPEPAETPGGYYYPNVAEATLAFPTREPGEEELDFIEEEEIQRGQRERIIKKTEVWRGERRSIAIYNDQSQPIMTKPSEEIRALPTVAYLMWTFCLREGIRRGVFQRPLENRDGGYDGYKVKLDLREWYKITRCVKKSQSRKILYKTLKAMYHLQLVEESAAAVKYFRLISSVTMPKRGPEITVLISPEYSAKIEKACIKGRGQLFYLAESIYHIDCNKYRSAVPLLDYLAAHYGRNLNKLPTVRDSLKVETILEQMEFIIPPKSKQKKPGNWKRDILRPFLANIGELVRVGALHGFRFRRGNQIIDVEPPRDWEDFESMNFDFWLPVPTPPPTGLTNKEPEPVAVFPPVETGKDGGQWAGIGTYAAGNYYVRPEQKRKKRRAAKKKAG